MNESPKVGEASCDVLVVGSGAGALCAALRARDHGLDVLVIEKSEQYGGTSAVSGGGIWIPNNHRIAELGGEDSVEDALRYLRNVVGADFDEQRLRAYVENGRRMVEYLAHNTRVQFEAQAQYADYYPETDGGKPGYRSMDPLPFDARELGEEFLRMRAPTPATLMMGRMSMTMKEARVMLCRGPGWIGMTAKVMWRYWSDWRGRRLSRRDRFLTLGNALIGALRRSLMDRDVPLWLNCALEELLVEDDRVVGVLASRDGRSLRIRARHGVILAAGGFERDPAMRAQYLPKPSSCDWSATPPHNNTGDAIRAGQGVGAATALMEHGWWAPTTRVEGEDRQRPIFVERALPGCILVDAAGRRFVNEAAPYTDIVYAMYGNDAPAHRSVPCWMLFDADFRHKYPCGGLLPGYAMPDSRLPENLRRSFHKGDSLAELAGLIGVEANGLQATVARFNPMAEAGDDQDFGKGKSAFDRYYGDPGVLPNPCLAPLRKAPFYAIRIDAGDIGTKGGLCTDANARVLREDGSAIAGLYAIGNCAASPMGKTYPGAGSTLGPAMVFGYQAANHLYQSSRQPAEALALANH